jgi:uncharacterized protein YecE (DUF72 family)
MKSEAVVELFLLKCASLKFALEALSPGSPAPAPIEREPSLSPFLSQFPAQTRHGAEMMAEHYKLFYMLENDIRKLIDDTMIEAKGRAWWAAHAPGSAKEECKANQKREQEAGVKVVLRMS